MEKTIDIKPCSGCMIYGCQVPAEFKIHYKTHRKE